MQNELIKFLSGALHILQTKNDDPENIKNLKIQNTGKALFIILKNLFSNSEETKQDVFKKFEVFQEIYADVISSESNPNCSCKNRVIHFFAQNPEKISKLLFDLINKNQITDLTSQNIIENIKSQINFYNQNQSTEILSKNNFQIDISGQIWDIEDSPKQYALAMQSIKKRRLVYKGLSVIKENNRLKLFFY